jgi:UDP-galactopyranose mutase
MQTSYPLVVFSHLRWDFVYQRPQHLLSRIAAGGRTVLFIEEPEHVAGAHPHWKTSYPAPGVLVARPQLNVKGHGFADEQHAVLIQMVRSLLATEGVRDFVAWLYTPLALPIAQAAGPLAIVYDCMDDLSSFKHAPPRLIEREAELMKLADVVFTGGPSLYRARKSRHHNIHCFPSSVDATHFGSAASAEEPADQAALPRPRLGYFGVIDERMNLDIIRALAEARPDWQIVMVGPVAKIDESALPKAPNILYTGQRSYEDLPRYLGGWDVSLLPFALNEATRFISPTKTLEYMAAGVPVVSTPITDVVEPYGDIVYLGSTADEFVAACDAALNASPDERWYRIEAGHQVVAGTSWAAIARAMDSLIDEAALNAQTRRASATTAAFSFPSAFGA